MPRFLIQATVSRIIEADDEVDAKCCAEALAAEYAELGDDGFGDTRSFSALPIGEMPVITR